MTIIAALSPFDAAAILIVLAALFAYFNHRVLKLPTAVGLTVTGLIASLAVIGIDQIVPQSTVAEDITRFINELDFHSTLMDGMLSFLLFAGALHVDLGHMAKGKWPILILSTIGVVISTLIVGGAIYCAAALLGLTLPLIWALVFGALISPTDPVSVMGVLQRANVSPTLEATVAGESLFNDGVGVVVFAILLSAAISGEPLSLSTAATMFAMEAGGGILIGLAVGYVAFRMMRSIDEYKTEVLLSIAVVMGGYALAHALHVSGPVAMAVAGLLIGNHGVTYAMSDLTRDYLHKFWAIIDDILNTVLFLLIGLEVVAISSEPAALALGLIAIPVALAARAIAVGLPLKAMQPILHLGPLAPVTLVWGGLRGGISVALALGLANGPERSLILTATYIVVLFSVIVQGGTIEKVLGIVRRKTDASIGVTVAAPE